MQDLFNELKISRVISPDEGAADNTAKVGQIIDNQNFDSLVYVIGTGTVGDAAATFAALLEESTASDLSGSNAVADGDLIGTEALFGFDQDDDDSVRKLGYKGTKRYTRLTVTPSDNGTAWDIAAFAIQGNARKDPQSSQS